jgi:hypothetical protein
MYEAGEYEIALNEISEVLRSSDLKLVDSPEMADLRLLAARLYWHQSKFAKSILCAGHAVIARPKILGRPLKSLMRRFGLAEPPGETITKV